MKARGGMQRRRRGWGHAPLLAALVCGLLLCVLLIGSFEKHESRTMSSEADTGVVLAALDFGETEDASSLAPFQWLNPPSEASIKDGKLSITMV